MNSIPGQPMVRIVDGAREGIVVSREGGLNQSTRPLILPTRIPLRMSAPTLPMRIRVR
jgi:hypothetical protein